VTSSRQAPVGSDRVLGGIAGLHRAPGRRGAVRLARGHGDGLAEAVPQLLAALGEQLPRGLGRRWLRGAPVTLRYVALRGVVLRYVA
jgi:hypothetical protein